MSSNNEVLAEIKNEDKKPKKVFWIVLVCGGLLGFVGGFVTAWLEDSTGFNNWIAVVADCIYSISVYVGVVTSVIAGVAATVLYRQSRKIYADWDEDDDDAMMQIESKLSLASLIANGNLIFTYIFMVIGFAHINNFEKNGLPSLWTAGVFLVGVVLSMVVAMVASVKIVNFEKEMNPEKKGSAYDFNFQKKWMASSDEAEKLVHYKAAYKSFKLVNITCMILWASCMFGMLLWDWGLVPVIMVGTIWLVCYLSYGIETLKLSKHASKIQE